jgi:hypothetical protein
MANRCEVCGHPCGWWRTVHPECEPLKHQIDRARFEEHRRDEQTAVEQYPIVVEELGRHLGEHLRPVDQAPTLFSINGIGTKLDGRDRYDSGDGFVVATQWFCFLWIPLAPVARYRVVCKGWRKGGISSRKS